MQVIHGGCESEMFLTTEIVWQGAGRAEEVKWYQCPVIQCSARIRASEIMDGIRFCNGGRVEINGKTFMTGMHRVTWHGGQDQASLRFERESPMDRYKRLAREAGVNLHESTDCPSGVFMGINRNTASVPEMKPLTIEDIKRSFADVNRMCAVDGSIRRVSATLNEVYEGGCVPKGTVVEVADNRMFRVGDQVLLHNVNDGFSNRPDVPRLNLSRVAYVYETWDDTLLW